MQTALYDRHIALGAKMVEFAGWEMPLRYTQGTLAEYHAVREAVGLFDVSHMGCITIEGPDAASLLEFLSTNTISNHAVGSATYTLWCYPNGTVVDDLIIFRLSDRSFTIVVNASNRDKDLRHLQQYAAGKEVQIIPHYEDAAILALQGPKSRELLAERFPQATALPHRACCHITPEIILSRTGYTGELGYEIYGPNAPLVSLWDWLLDAGKRYGLSPAGLGARDILRLEMGYALYGHELNDHTLATATVSSWAIRKNKPDFLGKEALCAPAEKCAQYGAVVDGGVAREGHPVLKKGQEIGVVTSGLFSPKLNQAIAIVMLKGDHAMGAPIEIEVRGKHLSARLTPLPFVPPHHKEIS